MRFLVYFLLIIVSTLLWTACHKDRNENPGNVGAEVRKMGGNRPWEIISQGFISEIDTDENRFISYTYSDTIRTSFAVSIVDDSTINLRGNNIRIDSVDRTNMILHFSNKRLPRTTAYLIELKLEYYVKSDSVVARQDSTYYYDPNTLFLASVRK